MSKWQATKAVYAKGNAVLQAATEVATGGPAGAISQAAARATRPGPAAPDPTKQNLDGFLGKEREALSKAEGALQTFGATMALVTGFEQAVSKPFMSIPCPAFPALRIGDVDIGRPHGHNHPPNLVPPAPMILLPSFGPVIPIPFVSGAEHTLINGRPAARCGDMGIGVFCGGFLPLFEIVLGSASVWIEGARAARTGVDITNHCIFSARKGPSDKPIGGSFLGTTIDGSSDVLIGGVPMPSLTNMAMGLAFRGAGRVVKAIAHTKPGKVLTKKVGEMGQKAKDAVKKIVKKDAADTIPDLARAGDTLPGIGPTRYDGAARHMDTLDIALADFGKETTDLVRKSPSLSNQVRQLHGEGYNIKRGNHPSEIDRAAKEIRIKEGQPLQEVGALGHEAGHGIGPAPPELPKNSMSEADYIHQDVENRMADEGRAQFNEAKVLDEVGDPNARISGNHSDDYYQTYDRYKDGKISQQQAEREMAERMKDDVTGNTGEEYLDYYAKHARRKYNQP